MPIGDPMGGDAYDLGRGRLKRIWMATVPVTDLEEAADWYRSALGLDILYDRRADNWIEMGMIGQDARIALYVPKEGEERMPGIDTGIMFATESIFEVHRRLVDEGVVFVVKPKKQSWGGLLIVFLDPFGNRLGVIEDAPRPAVEAHKVGEGEGKRDTGVTIRTIVTK
ncbi:MAG: VOC family protein [Euryarchaeota archaeon]|nr:VOC family protein [Euryarchaeota archaeon]